MIFLYYDESTTTRHASCTRGSASFRQGVFSIIIFCISYNYKMFLKFKFSSLSPVNFHNCFFGILQALFLCQLPEGVHFPFVLLLVVEGHRSAWHVRVHLNQICSGQATGCAVCNSSMFHFMRCVTGPQLLPVYGKLEIPKFLLRTLLREVETIITNHPLAKKSTQAILPGWAGSAN